MSLSDLSDDIKGIGSGFSEVARRLRHSRAAFELANGRLPQPVELVRVQRFGNTKFRAAIAEMQGWRGNHEDSHAVVLYPETESAVFLVLDGHGGDEASQFCAPALARALGAQLQPLAPGHLPEDSHLGNVFEQVDLELREHAKAMVGSRMGDERFHAGTTVVGGLVSRSADGSYAVKLLNLGDSRAIIVRGQEEHEGSASGVSIYEPKPLQELKLAASEKFKWPLIFQTVDHKPNHPVEKARINAAGGTVTEGRVPRVDGLAVSRALGDFSYKDVERPGSEQKVSWVPDISEVCGLQPSSILILACDGLWDALPVEHVAEFVRDELKHDPAVDLGSLCTELVSLSVGSRDNVTAMIVHLVDGSDFMEKQDEMKCFEKFNLDPEGMSSVERDDLGFLAESGEIGDAIRERYHDFLVRSNFSLSPKPCAVCGTWNQNPITCACEVVSYCCKQCQYKHWELHMVNCSVLALVRRACCESLINKQFRRFDTNGDGRIDRVELMQVLSQLDPVFWNPENLDNLLQSCDTDKDGYLSYEEFVRWVCVAGLTDDPLVSAFYRVLKAPEWKVLKQAVFFSTFQPSLAGPKRAWILVFIDVDGVLNTTAEQKSYDEGRSAAGTLQDPSGKCGVGLNQRCLELMLQLMKSLLQCDGGLLEPESSRMRLVISSTWRLNERQMDFLRWALAEIGIDPGFIGGCTSSLAKAGRGTEVLHFLAECAWNCQEVSAWVVVDDNEDNLEGLEEPNSLLTYEVKGLDVDDVSRAWNTLVEQDVNWHRARELPEPSHGSLDLGKHEKPVAKAVPKRGGSTSRRASSPVPKRSSVKAKRAASPKAKSRARNATT